MERLTIRTEKGAALKLDAPKNEQEAREQLQDKYLAAIAKLAHYEDMEERGDLVKVVHCNECEDRDPYEIPSSDEI